MDVLVVDTPTLKKEVWAARSSFLTAIEADTKLLDELDVVVPVDRIAEFLVYTRELGGEFGLTVRNFGHAGDGNLHIYACSNDLRRRNSKNGRRPDGKGLREVRRVRRAGFRRARHRPREEGISARVRGGHRFGLMQAIKAVFDPDLILNPGKVCMDI
jgi:glycolate oxidase